MRGSNKMEESKKWFKEKKVLLCLVFSSGLLLIFSKISPLFIRMIGSIQILFYDRKKSDTWAGSL